MVFVMFITTIMVTIIMLIIWKTSIWWIALFLIVFGGVELVYLSSVVYKFTDGGYLPLSFSLVLMIIMGVWHYGHVGRYKFELKNKVSSSYISDLAQRPDMRRIPGVGLLFSELVQGIPPILPDFIEKIPSIHSILVVVLIKHLPITKVDIPERFLFRRIESCDYRNFRCVVRYGYKDTSEDSSAFEHSLIERLKEFVCQERFFQESKHIEQSSHLFKDASTGTSNLEMKDTKPIEDTEETQRQKTRINDSSGAISNRSTSSSTGCIVSTQEVEDEVQFIQKEMSKGVVYLLGETEVVAEHNSSLIKKILVDYMYNFMRRNFRQQENVMSIPYSRLLRVGMT